MASGSIASLCNSITGGVCSGMWISAYNSSVCQTVFAATAIPLGLVTDTIVNTIGCRQNYVGQATASAMWFCNAAGLSGGGICGDPLANTCLAVAAECSGNTNYPFTSQANCMTNLAPLAAFVGSNQGTPAAAEDTLECRIYHGSVGGLTTLANAIHCNHTQYVSPCSNGPIQANGGHHCLTTLTWCNNTINSSQYSSQAQCMTAFAAFPPTPVLASGTNDQGSRQYHTQVAASGQWGSPPTATTFHCQHGGPTGANVVGNVYQAWGSLAANLTACNSGANAYVNQSVTQAFLLFPTQAKAIVPADANVASWNIGAAPGNFDSCRVQQLVTGNCAGGTLLGGGVCGGLSVLSCLIVITACPTAYSGNQTACQSDFTTNLIATNKLGSGSVITGDVLSCRIYQASMALAFVGMGNASMAASYCPNVLATGGSCSGMVMAPTSSAASVMVSAAALCMALFV
jgi:hypothetical protein